MIDRTVVSEEGRVEHGDDFPASGHGDNFVVGYFANNHRVDTPLLEHIDDFVFPSLVRNRQHALLTLAEHQLVPTHVVLTNRDEIEVDGHAHSALRGHFDG